VRVRPASRRRGGGRDRRRFVIEHPALGPHQPDGRAHPLDRPPGHAVGHQVRDIGTHGLKLRCAAHPVGTFDEVAPDVARALAQTLNERPLFCDLISEMSAVLERNVTADTARELHTWTSKRGCAAC
jgi:hypothetical protein